MTAAWIACVLAAAAPAGDLVWHLDEGRGKAIRDASGRHPGVLHGAAWHAGLQGKALRFGGYGDFASLGDLPIGEGDFTLAAWICPRTVADHERYMLAKERSGDPNSQMRLYVGAGNRLGFVLSDNAGKGIWPFETEEGAVPAGRWTHVAVTRQGTGCVLYVNGRVVGRKSSEVVLRHDNTLELRLGARFAPAGDGADGTFDGLIDEVVFCTRALSQAELASPAALLRKAETTPVTLTPNAPRRKPARPTPQQAEWQDLELGMFIHFAPNTWQNQEGDDLSTPLDRIDPARLDTDQWVRVAESMGARYIVFVAKHVGGFCWWQTETTDYSVKSIPWRGGKADVMADLAESCRKRGMKLGVYLSPADGKHGVGVGGRCKTPAGQDAYGKVYRAQLGELLSRYGDIVEVWFDGSLIVPVGDILKRYAPRAMVFQGPHATIRWVGTEAGNAPYPAWNGVSKEDARSGVATAQHGTPDGDAWLPNEVDTVNVSPHCWFWNTRPERTLRSLDDLMECYYSSVGHGAVLLLNQTPDTTGLIPEADARRAAELGAEIRRRFGESLAETPGKGKVVTLDLGQPTAIDHVITMEEIRRGERVREYAIEGLRDGTWVELCRGTAIGHKKIDRFLEVVVSQVRLRVLASAAQPLIRRLAAYRVGG